MSASSKNNLSPGAEMISKGKSALAQIRNSAKKALRPSANAGDCTPAKGLAAVHVEQMGNLNRFGRFVKDEPTMDDQEQDEGTLGDTRCDSDLSGGQNPSPLTLQETTIQSSSSTPTTNAANRPAVLSLVSMEKALPSLPLLHQPLQAIFPHNGAKPFFRALLPKPGNCFNSTLQLAFANHLLPKKSSTSTHMPGLVITSGDDTQEKVLNEDEQAWMRAMEKDPAEQDRVRLLVTQVVAEFCGNTYNHAGSVAEIVLLGPVIDLKDYRRVLSTLVGQFEREPLLDMNLLQGLVQLLQSASPGYFIDDDLVRILRVLRWRLKNTHEQLGDANQSASAHIHQLASAVSRVLDVMVECNVKGLNRTEDHRPLLDILARLKESPDPYLEFQASYAYQALQYVGDDESPLHMVLRFGDGVVMAAAGAASIFQLDLESLFSGLRELGQAAGQAFDVAKAGIEGAQALRAGGEGVMDSLLKGFRSGARHAWYPALQGARVFIREGRLVDFKRMVYEAPCRREREFQWGVCHLLGEIAMDPVWNIETRQQAVDFLGELHRDSTHWNRDSSVKNATLGMLLHISGDAEQIIQRYAAKLLADLLTVAEEIIPKPYPLMNPLPLPTTSPLLVKAPKVPVVEQDIRLFLARRLDQHERHNQVVYIPPQAKASLEAKDDDSFPLMEKVKEFLENNQQVFLVLGDSGVGKSTFIRHLEQELMGDYKPGGRIPLFINLPAIDKPEKELISEQLKTLDFTDDNIQEMKRDRQFILICDGYDESQLAINLHSTNSFNQPDQWDVKMVISCRSTYLNQNYRDRFQPQPIDRYKPPTPHLFQEAVIVPFSNAQIKDYVEQFVRDKEVHKLFNGRPIWSSEEYVDKLMRVPKLMSLVTNPFLLILSLRTLPIMVYGVRDLTEIEVSRARMYEVFVQQWLEINVRRLRFSKLKEEATTILEELIEAGLTQIATEFLKDLAAAIYQEQDGNQLVRYIHRDDKETWKARFFGPAIDAVLLRDVSPLSRAGTLYRFIHRTLLEYFYGFEEGEIHQFKSMRLREYEALRQKSYIPPMAKASPQASDDESFPLMDKIKEFLHSDEQVFLVLGDYRAGKTTFSRHLENELLATYKQDGPIPLFINLPTFEEQETDLISKQLGRHNFSNDVIQEFKKHRRFIVICDGYDTNRFSMNLYTTNSFNRPGQWRVKMIVSCRSMRHDIDYRRLFEPQSSDRRGNTTTSLFQMAVMIPFSTDQVRNYVKQFVRDTEVHELYGRGSAWDMEELMNKILKVSNIEELVSVPFLLTQALTALSKQAQSEQDFSDVRLTRVEIYDLLAEQWLQTNKGRLDDRPLPTGAGLPCNELVDSDFLREGIKYQKDLAAAIFEHQGGEPVIEYSDLRDTKSWKARFFGPDVKTTILRESSFVTRSGNRYRFLQRSLLDYFYCRVIFDPFEQGRCSVDDGSRETGAPLQTVNHPLNQRNIVKDPGTLLFLAERVGQCPLFKKQLFATIEESKIDSKVSQAAANAITILVRAGERFTGMDLSGTRIAGADLSGGDFDSVQLAGADLTGVTLTKAWLRHANFRGAQMRDVQFGVWPYLELRAEVNTCAYSSDGKFFVIGFGGGAISLYRTETWEKVRDFGGHDWTVTALAFSPENDQLASSSEDKLVKVWNIKTGALEHTIGGQSETVASVVYSPKGHLIAAASYDNFVRLYDIPERDPDQSNIDVCSVAFILKGHTGAVKSVTFSPSGLLIATASYDWTVRLWEPEIGVQKHVLRGHTAWVTSVSISPTNNMVASSGQDMTVRLWNTVTGTGLYILRGHTAFVKTVSFSPSGHQLASSSGDHTVRLWDGLTGTPGRILSGHTQTIPTLAYSPDKQQIATGSWDSTVRLWNIEDDALPNEQNHSTGSVEGVAISPGNSRAGSIRGHLYRTDLLSSSIDIVTPTFATAVDINSNDHMFSFSVVACSSDGQVVATCSRNVARLHDAYTGASKMELHGHTDSVTSLAFSPDNQLLVTGSYDRTVRIWKIQNGECGMVLEGHTEAVTTVAFSPSGFHIATGSDDRTVKVWSVRTGRVVNILLGHVDVVKSLSYSSDSQLNQLASGGGDFSVKLWNARAGTFDRDLKGHTNAIESVSFSTDGKKLASASRDATARIWDVSTGQMVHELTGHRNAVTAIAFSPNNLRVATGGWDKTVRIWDVKTGRCLVKLTEFVGEVNSIAWKPMVAGDGGSMYFVTGYTDKSVMMWKLVESGDDGNGDNGHRVHLHWRSGFDGLMVSSAIMEGVVGLSKINQRLLEQRGAIGEPRWP